jgi:hypothetical protein
VRALAFGIAMVLAAACGGGDDQASPPPSTVPDGTPGPPSAAELCAGVALVEPVPTVAADGLDEASGLAASRVTPGLLWAHDDSGGDAAVYAIGPDGSDRGAWPLDGVDAFDWEDMARGPGPDGTGDLLYLGDIGDNRATRDDVAVVRAPEPAAPEAAAAGPIAGAEAVRLAYADGPRDAEALIADPLSGDLVIVDKSLLGGSVGAYVVPAATPWGPVGGGAEAAAVTTIERAGDVNLGLGQIVTGADVSSDGSLVAVRTYTDVWLWDRAAGRSVPEAMAGEPCQAPAAAEQQGESVALDPDGRGYTTVSEGEHPAVNHFRLP